MRHSYGIMTSAANDSQQFGHMRRLRVGKGFFSRRRLRSAQPRVQPSSAVHVTAGLLPSADQVPVKSTHSTMPRPRWADRRINRLCITCCLPFPTVRSRRMRGRDLLYARVRRVLCSPHPCPSLPRRFEQSCWRAQRRRPWWAAAPTMPRSRRRCLSP
jgi:hypothetical protein